MIIVNPPKQEEKFIYEESGKKKIKKMYIYVYSFLGHFSIIMSK